ncbi:hypothetical protein PVK06_016923 [Gossypium arboreum]|uniref:Uncharacterized protein n=1 Tax=Gossypium arboreum TaxID=29729 RepID=A0ABR0Q1I5_GOSAR|nr:hypothetical protein PVK06_016923 [Gossypium arboreum]
MRIKVKPSKTLGFMFERGQIRPSHDVRRLKYGSKTAMGQGTVRYASRRHVLGSGLFSVLIPERSHVL